MGPWSTFAYVLDANWQVSTIQNPPNHPGGSCKKRWNSMMQWAFVVWVWYLDDGRNGMVEEKLEGWWKWCDMCVCMINNYVQIIYVYIQGVRGVTNLHLPFAIYSSCHHILGFNWILSDLGGIHCFVSRGVCMAKMYHWGSRKSNLAVGWQWSWMAFTPFVWYCLWYL